LLSRREKHFSGISIGHHNRFNKVLFLRREVIYSEERMLVPKEVHETNTTKKSWVTFYSPEKLKEVIQRALNKEQYF